MELQKMTVQIDRDIPIPERRRGGSRPAIYPFGDMSVGDSFSLPGEGASRLGSAAQKWRERHPGWDYRTAKKDGEVRLWRIS